MSSMTDLTERLRELLAEATPGPWRLSLAGATIRAERALPAGKVSTRIAFGYDGSAEARAIDFRLITELRNNADDLLTTLETLTQENARLRKYLNEIGLAAQVSAALCDDGEAEPFQMIADRARKALGGGDE